MKFLEKMQQNPMTLVVSLPRNDATLAAAAVAGGADAVKFHMNLQHRASGNHYGDFAQNEQLLRDIRALCPANCCVGLVPGAEEAYITPAQRDCAVALGVDFVSSYVQHLPLYMLDCRRYDRVLAVGADYAQYLPGLSRADFEVLEASIVPAAQYRTALHFDDLLRYAHLAHEGGKPVLVPTQKKILPTEVRHLYDYGVRGIMIGAVVFPDDTPATVERVTRAFREAIAKL